MTDALIDLEHRLRHRLAGPLPGAAAHWHFAPHPPRAGWAPDDRPDSARQAAALVLLYARAGIVYVPLTVRHHDLPHHAGQLSLPGGAIDPGESPQDAATRETEEEIGIGAATVRILGTLSSLWVPVSNFVIHPVVGVIDREPTFHLHEREVSTLLEVPVATLCDPDSVRAAHQVRDGVRLEYRAFEVQGHTVWGATAMMLSEFVRVCDARDAASTT